MRSEPTIAEQINAVADRAVWCENAATYWSTIDGHHPIAEAMKRQAQALRAAERNLRKMEEEGAL